jgi:hypothetical protein
MFEAADATEAAFAAFTADAIPLPRDGEPVLSPAVQRLVDDVDAVVAQAPAELPPAQALADTAALLNVVERLRGALLGRVADVDARQLHVLDGSATAGAWVERQQTSLGRGEIALARRLVGFPCLVQAVREGSLSVAVAERVGKALGKLRPHLDRPDGLIDGQDGEQAVTAVVVDGVRMQVCQALGGLADDDPRVADLVAALGDIAASPVGQLARVEAAFVLLAGRVEPAQLPGALGMLVDALLPNELERKAEDGWRNRGFGLKRKDDGSGWRITAGDLDLECGELLHTVLQAELATDPDNPADTEGFAQLRTDGWQAGDELPSCGGPRSLRQRRHDAFKNALRRYLDSGVAGLRDKVAPHVNVTIGIDALHAEPGSLPGVAASGARLPLSVVRRWWGQSAATRFILSLGHRVVEMSHTQRTLKPHERKIKNLETGGRCQGAGCAHGLEHGPLIPHHPEAFARCGTTSVNDTVMFCEPTHHDLHVGGKTIQLKDGRGLNADGWADGPGPWDATSR